MAFGGIYLPSLPLELSLEEGRWSGDSGETPFLEPAFKGNVCLSLSPIAAPSLSFLTFKKMNILPPHWAFLLMH